MKILIVSQYYYPERNSVGDVASFLVKNNHDVTVLTAKPNYGFQRILEEYKNIDFEIVNGVKVHRLTISPRKYSRLSVICNYLSFYFKSLRYVNKFKEKFDVVLSFSIAINFFAPAIKIARVKPPGPGPTSTTVMFSMFGMLRAIRDVKFKSKRKFCPNCFFGSNPLSRIISDTGGKDAILSIIISCAPRTPTLMCHRQYNLNHRQVAPQMPIQKKIHLDY